MNQDIVTWFKISLILLQFIAFACGALFGINLEKWLRSLDKKEE